MKILRINGVGRKRIWANMLFLLVLFLIASCSPKMEPIPPTGTSTVSPSPSTTYSATPTVTETPTQTPSVTPTATPTFTPTPTWTATPTPTPTAFGNAAGVLMGTCNNQNCLRGKIFHLDPVTGDIYQVGEEGYHLQDVSPDGKILYSSQGSLFSMDLDGNNIQRIFSNFFDYSSDTGAYWLSPDEVVFVSNEGLGAIYKAKSDGSNLQKIVDQRQVLVLLPTVNNTGIFWQAGYNTSTASYGRGIWWSEINANEDIELEDGFKKPKFSQSGQLVTYVWDAIRASELVIATTNGYEFQEVGVYLATTGRISKERYFISPDERKIIVQEIFGDPDYRKYPTYMIAPDGSVISELPDEIGDIWFVGSWSPDSKLFFYNCSSHSGAGYVPTLLNLETMELTPFDNEFLGSNWLMKIFWIPWID